MYVYLVKYSCSDGGACWPGRSLVKARNVAQAWDKFEKSWAKDIEKGKADVPFSSVIECSLERICTTKDMLF